MNNRKIADFSVSPVGMGCMGLSHAYGTAVPKAEAVEIIRSAFEMGYTFFDTAECYTGQYADGSTSYNEELVGEALHDIRDKVIIATKCGVTHGGDHLILDSSPVAIRKAVEGSLKRLKLDCIDLYYQHRIDPKVAPETVAETMKDLIKEGKIKAWGISETDKDYLLRANSVCKVAAIQNRYSMIARWNEELFPALEENNIALVAFSPIANGFLSGNQQANGSYEEGDFRNRMPQYSEEGIKKGQALTDFIKGIAEKHGATAAQISLAWMLCKKPYIIPIPGSRKLSRLNENLHSADISLSSDEIRDIDAMLKTVDVPIFGGHK